MSIKSCMAKMKRKYFHCNFVSIQLYKRSYWSYSKTMLRHPLTISVGIEEDEICLQLFYTILVHSGKQACMY